MQNMRLPPGSAFLRPNRRLTARSTPSEMLQEFQRGLDARDRQPVARPRAGNTEQVALSVANLLRG